MGQRGVPVAARTTATSSADAALGIITNTGAVPASASRSAAHSADPTALTRTPNRPSSAATVADRAASLPSGATASSRSMQTASAPAPPALS